ncbi:tryptophan synthase subunit alpha [Nanoarchaeota archaeon]
MSRYKKTFKELAKKKQKAFIPFTVVGDPDYKTSIEIVKAMVENGADILELGFPFSDPIADGPTIQAADVRALKKKINTDDCFKFIEDVRKFTKIPIGLLVYSNIIYQRGIDKFYKDAAQAGADSILCTEVPPEEAEEYIAAAKKNKIDTVFIATELTSNERLNDIVKKTTGFVYVVARLGVTGAQKELGSATVETLMRIRPLTKLPLCVGFGISEPKHAKQVIKAGADGVIVGSQIVKIIEKNLKNKNKMIKEVGNFVKKMKEACK